MPSLHERMMQGHGPGSTPGHKGMPKDITSYEITFKRKRLIAKETYEFTFAKPAGFIYKAGQHGRLTLIDPPETDGEGNARFLSFASNPSEPVLKFAMRMRDTAFKRVLRQLKPGTKVLWQMRKNSPHGSFALQGAADVTRPVVFLIGGIGIVPVFSLIKDSLEHEAKHKIILIYANRRPEDAPYLRELQQLAEQHADAFQFIPTMSELEKSNQTWHGETGRITKALIRKYIAASQAPLYYVAGLTDMVAAMQNVLADLGVAKEDIRAEEFGAFTAAHATKNKLPKSVLGLAIVALIVIMIIAHVVGASSLTKAIHSSRHAELQTTVIFVALTAILIYIKVRMIQRHRGRSMKHA